MKRIVLLAMIWGLLACVAQPTMAGFHGPQDEQFTQCLLRMTAEGELQLQKTVSKPVQEQHTREVSVDVKMEIDGKIVLTKETRPETYTITRFVSETMVVKLDPEAVELFDINGGPVQLAAVRARLKKPLLILVSADGKIHPSFASIFKAGTLVLADPPQPIAVPAPAAPVPIAPPASTRRTLPRGSADSLRVRLAGQEVEKAPATVPSEDQDFILPPQPAPTFRYCKLDEKGTVAVRDFRELKKEFTAYREIKVGNELQKVPFSVIKTIGDDQTVFWDRSLVKFVTTDGKALSPTQLAVLKQREHAVVASSDGKPVDPFWLQNVVGTTPVLLLPKVAPAYSPPSPSPLPMPPAAPVPLPAPAP